MRPAAIALLLLAAPALAVPKKSHKRPPPKANKGNKGRAQPAGPPLPPPSLELRSVDLAAGHAVVDVSGIARAPESHLFVLTDERSRRYLPSLVDCHPRSPDPEQAVEDRGRLSAAAGGPVTTRPSGLWRCSLEIPRIYQRSALVGLSVEIRGQTLSVPRERVQAAWAEARAQTPLPAAERPREPGAPWSPARRPPMRVPSRRKMR